MLPPVHSALPDTPSNVPVRELSGVPTVVGSDERLCAVAAERGWRVVATP